MIRFLASIILCCAAVPASAESITSGRVAVIQSYGGHTGLLIRLDAPYQTGEGCAGGTWYILPDNSVRASVTQAMIMTASASKQQISFSLSGCYEGYPRIIHVTVAG